MFKESCMRTACLTVFYDGMQQFADEYIQCIKDQTNQDFTLVVINDGFPGDLPALLENLSISTTIIEETSTPQQNRLKGMQYCSHQGFDVIICSDSDETMYPDRIEQNISYFELNPDRDLVFNNSVGEDQGRYFDLFLKPKIVFDDIVDINVLGYGAMNLRCDLVPFFVSLANEQIDVFDWWIGLRYLIENENVEVLDQARNHYRMHEGNIIGPVFEVNLHNIKIGLKVKQAMYSEMLTHCSTHGLVEKKIFKEKLDELSAINIFIIANSLDRYVELVAQYLHNRDKIYWWENIVSLNKLGVS
mgnify:FL=1